MTKDRSKVPAPPDVVAAQHGWWQTCRELDLPGSPVHGEATANLDAAVGAEHADPVSGSVPLRSYLCEVRRSGEAGSGPGPGSALR